MSQYDATFVGDTPVSVALYDSVRGDTLWMSDKDRIAQRTLFMLLTGVSPLSEIVNRNGSGQLPNM